MNDVVENVVVNTRKLASVCTVDAVSPIENADLLEVVTLKGKCWKIVNRKGDLKAGDRVVYFEIDSFLPVGNSNFEFLRERTYKKFSHNNEIIGEGFRIKTIKLRGVVSQGLVMSLSAFPELNDIPDCFQILGCDNRLEDGHDLTDALGVKNYDTIKEEMDMLQGKMCCGNHAGNFPSFIPKTDEERCCSFDTKIVTDQGELTIADVQSFSIPVRVKSFNHEKNKVEFKEITGFSVQKDNSDWYEIITESGKRMVVTGNHRIWCQNLGVYREVKDFDGTEILMTSTHCFASAS